MGGPGGLAEDDPGNPRIPVWVLVEDLEVTLAVLDVGAEQGFLAAGERIVVELARGPLATVSLAKLIELVAAGLSWADVVNANLS